MKSNVDNLVDKKPKFSINIANENVPAKSIPVGKVYIQDLIYRHTFPMYPKF